LGGPPAAGKTTVATRLARRHGLRLHHTDTRTWAHRDRALAAGHHAAARWEALDPAARWELSDDELLELSLHHERGPMVVDDVRALPRAPIVLVEGSSVPLPPPGDFGRALWLLPTASFQDAQLAARPIPDGHRRLYRRLRELAELAVRDSGVPAIVVDGSTGIDDLTDAVEAHFAAALAAGPCATTGETRRALVREANLAVVGQMRAYFARPWAQGDAEGAVQTFLCECGGPACDADVVTTVAQAAEAPVSAPGHGRRG
jgi:hypothetical protein